LRSYCACAVAPKSEAKPSKDTTTLSFIKPPFRLCFGAGRQYRSSAARFAERPRQEGCYPHLSMFLLAHIDARTAAEVT
jgi:hypothetical protein